MFRNIKTVKHIEARAFWGVAFMDIQNISNHSSFIYKPTQEIDDKQVPKYDFNKWQLLKNSNQLFLWLSGLATDQEYPRE